MRLDAGPGAAHDDRMMIRDLVGWAAWGSDGVDNAATHAQGAELLGRRIMGYEGDLSAHMLLTGTVVGTTFEAATWRWVVRTASGSLYRLGESLHATAANGRAASGATVSLPRAA